MFVMLFAVVTLQSVNAHLDDPWLLRAADGVQFSYGDHKLTDIGVFPDKTSCRETAEWLIKNVYGTIAVCVPVRKVRP